LLSTNGSTEQVAKSAYKGYYKKKMHRLTSPVEKNRKKESMDPKMLDPSTTTWLRERKTIIPKDGGIKKNEPKKGTPTLISQKGSVEKESKSSKVFRAGQRQEADPRIRTRGYSEKGGRDRVWW